MAERILSAGVVVVSRVDDDWRVLLLRVYNYWDCPKGVVEAGEDPLGRRPPRGARRNLASTSSISTGAKTSSRRRRIPTTRSRGTTLPGRNIRTSTLPVNPELGRAEASRVQVGAFRRRPETRGTPDRRRTRVGARPNRKLDDAAAPAAAQEILDVQRELIDRALARFERGPGDVRRHQQIREFRARTARCRPSAALSAARRWPRRRDRHP